MASLLVITDVYQQVSAKTAVFTIDKVGKGTLFINTSNANDDTALKFSSDDPKTNGRQTEQRSTVNTYIRSSVNSGWEVIVDD